MKTCVRCNADLAQAGVREIDRLRYCLSCAEGVIKTVDGKKNTVKKEKSGIIRERDAIEKEMRNVSEDDTRHIVVTTTDTIETGRIIDYIDVVSVQDIIFQNIHIDPVQAELQQERVEKIFRNRIELGLSKLRKRAYLASADAVVGMHIDSSMEHHSESEYTIAVVIKISITGTAVRLTDR